MIGTVGVRPDCVRYIDMDAGGMAIRLRRISYSVRGMVSAEHARYRSAPDSGDMLETRTGIRINGQSGQTGAGVNNFLSQKGGQITPRTIADREAERPAGFFPASCTGRGGRSLPRSLGNQAGNRPGAIRHRVGRESEQAGGQALHGRYLPETDQVDPGIGSSMDAPPASTSGALQPDNEHAGEVGVPPPHLTRYPNQANIEVPEISTWELKSSAQTRPADEPSHILALPDPSVHDGRRIVFNNRFKSVVLDHNGRVWGLSHHGAIWEFVSDTDKSGSGRWAYHRAAEGITALAVRDGQLLGIDSKGWHIENPTPYR